jgi:transcriptional regulator with XRE-family HTH domain
MPPKITEEMSTGDRIAVWRTYRGMTQDACAGLVGKSLSWWKKIEQGTRRVEKLSDLLLIARVLKVRDLADLTGGLEFSLSLDQARDHPVVPAIRSAMLTATLDKPSADATTPDHLRTRYAQARRTFHGSRMFVAQTGQLLPGLITDATAAYHGAPDPTTRREIAAVLSEIYLLTCQILRDAGDFHLASIAIDRSLSYGHEADDPLLVALAVWDSSGVLKDLGHPDEGLAQCRKTLATLEPLVAESPSDERLSVLGELYGQAALMAAHSTDEGTAIRYLDSASAAYARVAPDYRNPTTAYSTEGASVIEVWVLAALGKSRRAVTAGDRMNIAIVPSRPVQALWRVNVAKGYAATRNDVATLHVLKAAEEASPEIVARNAHVREICREMLRRDRKVISVELHDFARRIGIFS